MVLKRKRSDSDISSASSLFSSPPSINSIPSNHFLSNHPRIPTPIFSSRTRKRHRDNRPSESEVHEHTLSILFSAQRNPQKESTPPSAFPSQEPIASLPSNIGLRQQSSLHSFWAIPSSRHSSPASNISTSSSHTPTPPPTLGGGYEASNCEDCNASLDVSAGDAMDVDMMMDMDTDGGSLACISCGKHVCHGCAVSNLGKERKCLNCAGRN